MQITQFSGLALLLLKEVGNDVEGTTGDLLSCKPCCINAWTITCVLHLGDLS
jgi:hypothetical protein